MSLRNSISNMSDEHQRLLVQVAFHALNDARFATTELPGLTGCSEEQLVGPSGFSEAVAAPLFDLATGGTTEALEHSKTKHECEVLAPARRTERLQLAVALVIVAVLAACYVYQTVTRWPWSLW